MPRTPDPKVTQKRLEAVQLEKTGLNARQIAETMGVRKVATVQKWLQAARGPKKPPFKAQVIEMLQDGDDFETIVATVGCTHENVRKIEREIRSSLSTGYSWRERRVRTYLADPNGEIKKRHAKSESFWRDLLSHCNQALTRDPKKAKPILEIGIQHFKTMQSVLRNPKKVRSATCHLMQMEAAMAARERALDRPQEGLSMIHQLIDVHSGCMPCHADLARREAIILHDLGHFACSLERVEHSESLYRQMGHNGHDGYGDGLASCALAKGVALLYARRFEESAQISGIALLNLPNASHEDLLFGLRYNQAIAMIEIPGRVEKGNAIANSLRAELDDAPSMPRLLVVRLLGYAAEKTACRESALSFYQDAFEDADSLEVPAAIGALESDIGRLSESPKEFQERLRRLLECKWLSSISNVLLEAHRISKVDFNRALSLLRKESGGDQIFPRYSSSVS